MERRRGKRGDIADRVFDKAPRVPFAVPDSSPRYRVGDRSPPVTGPERKRAEKGVLFRERIERIHYLAVKELEVGRVRHIKAAAAADEAVEKPGKGPVASALAPPVGFDALDDLIALLPERVHFGKLFRGVLQVAVHPRHCIAAGRFKPCEHRGLLAEIPRKSHAAYDRPFFRPGKPERAGIFSGRQGGYRLPAPVRGAVVHKYELMIYTRVVKYPGNAFRGYGYHLFLIVCRYYYRKHTGSFLSLRLNRPEL